MIATDYEWIGQYEFETGLVDITDADYDRGARGRINDVELPAGNYDGYVRYKSDGGIAELLVMDAQIKLEDIEDHRDIQPLVDLGDVGVDCGVCGVFEGKPDFSDREWEMFCADEIPTGEDGWITSYGICSPSGGSDGGYLALGWVDTYTESDELKGISILFE